MKRILTKPRIVGVLVAGIVLSFLALSPTHRNSYIDRAEAATCPNSTPVGSATLNFNVDATNVNNNHTVWSRIMVPTATSSYYLKLDASCYKVGGASLPTNKWTWVKYQDGVTGNTITTKFTTTGNHTATFIGDTADVKVDRVLILSSTCDPSQSSDGLGNNCTVAAAASTMTPTPTATTTAKPVITATVTANPPTSGGNGSNSGGSTTQPSTPPKLTAPSNLRAGFVFSNAMTINWDNSTGGSGQIGYQVYLNGASQGTTTVNSFGITNLQPNTNYDVKVVAYDQAQPAQIASSATKSFKTYGFCFLWWCW